MLVKIRREEERYRDSDVAHHVFITFLKSLSTVGCVLLMLRTGLLCRAECPVICPNESSRHDKVHERCKEVGVHFYKKTRGSDIWFADNRQRVCVPTVFVIPSGNENRNFLLHT